ncbi:MAG: peptidylprolyl isomerase [Phycisphaerales bacterium]
MRRFGSTTSTSLPLALASVVALGIAACDTPPRQGPRPAPRQDGSGPAAVDSHASAAAPVAAWRDKSLTWNDLRPALAELGGATAMRDAFLDYRIDQALAARNTTIDAAAIERERSLLVRSLDPDPNVAERLLAQIRQREDLGPVRFEALLKRNAGLRALVAADVMVTPEALVRQHDVLHGPKRVCRIVAVQTLQQADSIKKQLDAGASITDIAIASSTDASASRGGLLAPISRSDPTWPQAFRDALFALAPGQTSAPTLVDTSYLIIQLVEERPSDGVSLESSRAAVEDALRRAQERILMEEKARAFIAEIQPSIYDSALDAAWRQSLPITR